LADFTSHVEQAKKNISFLATVNNQQIGFWDWQIAISFYSAVHLVNGYLAEKANLHHRSHEEVKNALNPHKGIPICALPEDIYLAYIKLECLSRRARYLCSEDMQDTSTKAHFTSSKHFARSVRLLDKIIDHFNTVYKLSITGTPIFCDKLFSTDNLKCFDVNPTKKTV
jgi:hypothetical protein